MGLKGFDWSSKPESRLQGGTLFGAVDLWTERRRSTNIMRPSVTSGMHPWESELAGERVVTERSQKAVIRLGRSGRLVYGFAFVALVDWGGETKNGETE